MTDNELKELMEQYAEVDAELRPLIDKLDDMKRKIQDAVRERGESFAHGNVMAQWRDGYERQTWDGKKLTSYAVDHPEIMQFCKAGYTGPSVAVKVAA